MTRKRGFTLIELSIVLVVIGLIVGGILVGRDLISAATIRAQISQIEKYQQAVNTFRGKYGYLPGDIPDPDASNYGFQARGQYAGEGDGNGFIEGITSNAANKNSPIVTFYGETALFWRDLSDAKFIENTFSSATIASTPPTLTGTTFLQYIPEAKLGTGIYIYVWGGGVQYLTANDGKNYFGISAILRRQGTYIPVAKDSGSSMTVSQAFAMDSKIDDGLPQSGRVTASLNDPYFSANGGPTQVYSHFWASGDATHAGDSDPGGGPVVAGDGVSTTGSATTCYDNGGAAGATEQYSLSQNNGSGINCALSFKFQ